MAMPNNNQGTISSGIIAILVVVVGAIGFAGYRLLSSNSNGNNQTANNQNQASGESTLSGKVKLSDCELIEAAEPCLKQALVTNGGETYELTGQNAKPFSGSFVEVTGTLDDTVTPPVIEAMSIKPANQTKEENPEPDPVNKQPAPNSFSASEFYGQVQNGMDYNQVKELAGGTVGECSTTDVYPDSNRMNCTWSDSSLAVSVSFLNGYVDGKTKHEL